MAWVKVESSVSRNRKFVKAGPAPAWLWLCGLAFCQEGLTDGFIPTESLDYLGVKNAKNLAARLVEARLWDPVPGGWRIHDYLEHNKPAAEIRRTSRARAEGGTLGGRPPKNLQGSETETLEVSSKVNLPENHSGNPALTALTAGAPKQTATSARAPLVAKRRGSAAFEWADGFYVPQTLHQEFLERRSEAELLAWYEAVCREWTDGAHKGAEPGDMFRFWRAQRDLKWPPHRLDKPAPADPTDALLEANNRKYAHLRKVQP
jgi:hypothetical protein